MANTKPKTDLAFRPKGYFWPLDLKTHVVSSIKGAERKALVEKLFAEGREAEIPRRSVSLLSLMSYASFLWTRRTS